METGFILGAMKDIIDRVPFDEPLTGDMALDFAEMYVPHQVKENFSVMFTVDRSLKKEAICYILCPKGKETVIVVIAIRSDFEETFGEWLSAANKPEEVLDICCRRRELYCHEVCHLIAIILAFPSSKYKTAKQDFINIVQRKFGYSLGEAESMRPLFMVSVESAVTSPSMFDKDHFRYGDDGLNYFRLYSELMLDRSAAECLLEQPVREMLANHKKALDVARIMKEGMFVSGTFFDAVPDGCALRDEILSNVLKHSQTL